MRAIVCSLCLLTFGSESLAKERIERTPVVATYRSPGDRRVQSRVGSRIRAEGTIGQLKRLQVPLRTPEPGDWLAEHDEAGQSFAEYISIRPVTPTGRRATIYVQPLGAFTPQQRKIIHLSAEYLGLYMSRTVKVLDDLPLSLIPDSARRTHPEWGMEQILTTYVLEDVLVPRLPDDAATLIAFTASDLWPGKGWNFLYGQAMFRQRVGVWSIYRNGDPADSQEAFNLCLLRTLKTASHEVGDTFAMQHCTAWQCNMNGRNHREESDRSPLWLCSECHAKLIWATNTSAVVRFTRLQEFCERNRLEAERVYFESALEAVSQRK